MRTDGDTLYFDSSLFNVVDITAVHLHLTPGNGAINGEPFGPLHQHGAIIEFAVLSACSSSRISDFVFTELAFNV